MDAASPASSLTMHCLVLQDAISKDDTLLHTIQITTAVQAYHLVGLEQMLLNHMLLRRQVSLLPPCHKIQTVRCSLYNVILARDKQQFYSAPNHWCHQCKPKSKQILDNKLDDVTPNTIWNHCYDTPGRFRCRSATSQKVPKSVPPSWCFNKSCR